MALYASLTEEKEIATISDLTGTVLDSGDGVTHIIPVAEGFVIGSCIKHIPVAGSDITKFMMSILNSREKIQREDLAFVTMEIKEKYGYVCKNVVEEFKKYDKKELVNG